MKKYLCLLLLPVLICGCGKKVKTNKNITKSGIEEEDIKYTLNITCGGITKDSYVILNKDSSAEYGIYECNNDILELTTGVGTYKISDSVVTITDEYSNKVKINVKDDETIEVELDDIVQTLTK